ncbi:wall-associated receptor kinase 5-like [Canna indica]|uniref:Wall-associated receptor kinase 5-like n=1 Tax=Canna indica TaxID=4628 RepID=A0AAQ3KJ18_9LILI|nr:wall-associated receptor kinase 5-like [Canna indica]
MRSLLALVFILVLVLPLASCNRLNPSVLQKGSPNCYNFSIPFPFGINTSAPIARAGFEVYCNDMQGGFPMLQLGNATYQLLNISLEGYVRIAGRTIKWSCNSNGWNEPPSNVIDLTGTPYTFSETQNRFTATGCDAMAMIVADSGGPHNYTGGCVAFCPTPDSAIDGSCTGVGCCQAPVPRGLKSLRLNFTSIRGMTGSANDTSGTCSKAFIVEQSWFKFSIDDLRGNPNDSYRPVVLDWSIGNKTCEQARAAPDYACVSNHTDCYDAGTGYRCNCSQGYRGNPYDPLAGCLDIDECNDPNKHDCVWKCINEVGRYRCDCPRGSSGDGKKQGTGCNKVNMLEIGLGTVLGVLVIVVMVGISAYWGFNRMQRRRIKQRNFMQNGGLLLQQHISARRAVARIFSSEELARATDNFNESRVLGHGGYGTVYKGILSDDRVVAIKKSKFIDQNQIEQFINEVIILSQINHRNVVKLLGCCLETEVPLLVYEFISNGTLSHHVHSSKAPMSWENRLRIAVETAGALAYLHSATAIPIIHRDVKSANILLDEDFTAKVSDFGASRLIPYDQTHVTTLVQGTLGYLDPEYFQTSVLTEKSDVYSFGVVLMELLTREKPISLGRSEEERNLASHFITLLEEKRLLSVLDHKTVEEAGERQLLEVAQITRRCLNLKADDRPTMKEVAVELNALRRLLLQHAARQRRKEGEEWLLSNSPSNLCRRRTIKEDYNMECHHLLSTTLDQDEGMRVI